MLRITTLILGLGLVTAANAVDAKRGAALHNDKCVACHEARFGGNAIYTRNDRRVNSYAGLKRQVNFCKDNLQIVWFDEDVADVVEHLNNTFYHFAKE